MAIERSWERIAPILFIADGGGNGLVTVDSTELFKVKQKIVISSNIQPDLQLQVKKVLSYTELLVGPLQDKTRPAKPNNNLLSREDISAYLVADGATIRSSEQSKVKLTEKDILQAIYDQEPTLALRSFLVDYLGRGYNIDNPIPVAPNSTSKYVIHDIDEPTNVETYIGKETITGTWFIQYMLEVGKTTAITYANISNNPTITNYSDAWTDRLTLNYDILENLTNV